MPKPVKEKTYLDSLKKLGINISAKDQEHAQGDCPFCEKEGHLFLRYAGGSNSQTTGRRTRPGMWDCKSCLEHGNQYSFLKKFLELCQQQTTPDDYKELWKLKRISARVSPLCGAAKNYITGEWMLPTFGPLNDKGEHPVRNIHQWNQGNNKLYGIPLMPIGLIGLQFYEQSEKPLWLVEGFWDQYAMENILRNTGERDNWDVLGVPGAGAFKEEWLKLLVKREEVCIVFDNDHPRELKGGRVSQPGLDGMKRTAEMILAMDASDRPRSVKLIDWKIRPGDVSESPGWTDDIPDGYDVRDLLIDSRKPEKPTWLTV